jgi:hypothetical protein
MNFLPDLLTTLSYAAVIPIYAIFIYMLAMKKKKNRITVTGDSKNEGLSVGLDANQVSGDTLQITTSDGNEFNLSNLLSNESKTEENQYQILHKLVEIGVKKEVEGCFDEELLSLSWYRSN